MFYPCVLSCMDVVNIYVFHCCGVQNLVCFHIHNFWNVPIQICTMIKTFSRNLGHYIYWIVSACKFSNKIHSLDYKTKYPIMNSFVYFPFPITLWSTLCIISIAIYAVWNYCYFRTMILGWGIEESFLNLKLTQLTKMWLESLTSTDNT